MTRYRQIISRYENSWFYPADKKGCARSACPPFLDNSQERVFVHWSLRGQSARSSTGGKDTFGGRCVYYRGDSQRSVKNIKKGRGESGLRFHLGPCRIFYRRPIVTRYHDPMLAMYPTAIAGTHFKCDIKV